MTTYPDLKDKIALITGSTNGIGYEIAKSLASNHVQVILNYFHSDKDAIKAFKFIKKKSPNSVLIKTDVSNPTEIIKLFQEIKKTFGHLDILVNNAAQVFEPALTAEITPQSWNKTIDACLTGPFFCIQQAIKIMTHHGKIINISSTSGISGSSTSPAYAAAKAGLINLTLTYSKELAPKINVNAIAPGITNTRWHHSKPISVIQQICGNIPLKRIGKTIDIANSVLFLASKSSDYVTGQVLVINGGSSLK